MNVHYLKKSHLGHRIKILCVFSLSIILLAKIGAAQSSVNWNWLNFQLSIPTTNLAFGEHLCASMVVSNRTGEVRHVNCCDADECTLGFGEFQITDILSHQTKGCAIPDYRRSFVSTSIAGIQPHDTLAFKYDLTEGYGVDGPGTYQIEAVGRFYVDESKNGAPYTNIYSPPIIITIASNALSRAYITGATNFTFVTKMASIDFSLFEPLGDLRHSIFSDKRLYGELDKFHGTWGEPTEGFQLSIGMDKERYTSGEPVRVIMYLRNVTNRKLTFFYFAPKRELEGIDLVRKIQNSDGGEIFKAMKSTNDSENPGRMWEYSLSGGEQMEIITDLTKYYSLSPGEYRIHALQSVPNLAFTARTNVASAYASFKVNGTNSVLKN